MAIKMYIKFLSSFQIFDSLTPLKIFNMRLDSVVPNFKANTTFGPINFYDFQGDS